MLRAIRSTLLYTFAFASLQNLIRRLPTLQTILQRLLILQPTFPFQAAQIPANIPEVLHASLPILSAMAAVFMLEMGFTIILPGLPVTVRSVETCL